MMPHKHNAMGRHSEWRCVGVLKVYEKTKEDDDDNISLGYSEFLN
jgi:hypothetical protein